jgi:hypothetical protein
MRTVRVALATLVVLLLLQGCEDDPILEPTGDDSGGGSYGKMSPLSTPQSAELRRVNPETF